LKVEIAVLPKRWQPPMKVYGLEPRR